MIKITQLIRTEGMSGIDKFIAFMNWYTDHLDIAESIMVYEESCEIIIDWCKSHVHPYYFYGDPYNVYDWHQKEDVRHWDITVNLLGDFTFSLKRFVEDLYNIANFHA